MGDAKETHGELVTHPGTLQTRVHILPLTPLSLVTRLAAEQRVVREAGCWLRHLLASLLPDDAVVVTPPSIHTEVRYRALAAVQRAPLRPSHQQREGRLAVLAGV